MENQILEEDQLQEVVIDLNVKESGQLNESWLSMFGGWIKWIMDGMFKNLPRNVKVKGTKSQVNSFIKTLGREKSYIDTAVKHGLNDPRTYKNRYQLQKSVSEFERKTGLKWPFK